jgi:excisionase family DNA binding protein
MYRGQTRTCRLPTKRQPDHVMLTPAQAGLYLRLNVDRVRALIDNGIIKGTRIGRERKVSIGDLRAYRRRQEALMRKLGL